MSRFPRAGWERQGSTNKHRCKPSGNMVQESYEPPEEDVICSAYAKCRKPCHHAKPHKPAIVARKGFRGNDIDTHVDYPDGIICTTKGRCDMGLFVKCHEIPAEKVEINQRLIDALKAVYRKHVRCDDHLGWDEVSDIVKDALCEALGDEGFTAWLKEVSRD